LYEKNVTTSQKWPDKAKLDHGRLRLAALGLSSKIVSALAVADITERKKISGFLKQLVSLVIVGYLSTMFETLLNISIQPRVLELYRVG